ncbi:uracil phosphoribosyltransferase [Pedobacter sp. CFBP9032]|uniref:uracil phosphoribosyltransferase n=1 Tax=Pedobacter sp. CFBP9032 TaxID=3096539 RepID=UPI002A69AF42|nr:uracil phosphoribosyltransferase [Pedobacter sp. CFBP9032]MDY0904031.1 uracil phosphoribosyltransferase [Pedobacter sp. CFBP9032]
MIFDLSKTKSIANTFIAELRDENIQKDSMRFRKNLERVGEFFAYEISKSLTYIPKDVTTPLGVSSCDILAQQPVLATILRAGLPLQQGLLNIFDQAECCFISAFRKVKKSGDFVIQMDYVSTPDLDGRVLIMADPMLATGQSMVMCCKELISRYNISELHIVAAIASVEGVTHVRANLPKAKLWLGAIDEEMTSKSYIVPGLGDAGDLAYGEKV